MTRRQIKHYEQQDVYTGWRKFHYTLDHRTVR